MKRMKTTEAVGQVLCHDITQIIPGVTKDAVFRKGHIIREEDIPVLLSVGKDSVYIWENDETMMHENDAAEVLYRMTANEHMHPSDVKEGKIEVIADTEGLLKVDREKLKKKSSSVSVVCSFKKVRNFSTFSFGSDSPAAIGCPPYFV